MTNANTNKHINGGTADGALSQHEVIQQFEHMAIALGFKADFKAEPDGVLHRVPLEQDKRGRRSGWYVLYSDGMLAGCAGNWITGQTQSWSAKSPGQITPAEADAFRTRVAASKAAQRDAESVRHEQAARRAAALWHRAHPCTDHPYLTAKGITAQGVRTLDWPQGFVDPNTGERDRTPVTALVIPMRDTTGTLYSLAAIAPDGRKDFLYGGRKRGCYYALGVLVDTLCITEGFATGVSVYEATGHAVAVAFDCGNLLPVALECARSTRPCASSYARMTTATPPAIRAARKPPKPRAPLMACWRCRRSWTEVTMSKLTDFNDLHDPALILECITQAQPVALSDETQADEAELSGTLPPVAEPTEAAEDTSAPESFIATIQRLAALGQVEYDRVRKQEAKALGLRVSILDAEVEEARVKDNKDANAREDATSTDEFVDYETEDDHEDEDAAQKSEAAPGAPRVDGIPPDFFVTRDGVFYRARKADGTEKIQVLKVCSELKVTALVRDPASENWGRVLEFKDADGVPHQWVMPMAMLAGDGVDLRKELAQQGLEIAPGQQARNRLAEYITACKPQARGRCVQKTGWFQNVFVLPDRTLGASTERVLYQSEKATRHYAQAGTLDDWKLHVARLCNGNSRLILSVCAAFAGPLLHLAGQDSGGIHFVGPSSIGKTTLLSAGASVFGGVGYIQTWRATSNGLEGLCALHNDALLVLDEMGEVDPKEAGSIAYMVGNGAGKTRSDRHGDARAKKTWRLVFLSSGEIGLAQHMTEGGKAARAGQEVRLIDLPADAGAGYGVFENLHDFEHGGDLSNALKEATRSYYGTAGIAFIEAVSDAAATLPLPLKNAIADFVNEYLPPDAGGQAARVCARFAIMAVAGEVATDYGITGWEPGAAKEAAAACFEAWLDQRGGAGNRERATILATVRAFFETHGDARFTDVYPEHDRATVNRAGFRKWTEAGQEFYVLPEAYKREVCAGLDQRTVTKVLLEVGWLQPGKDGKSSQKKSLPGMGETRVYVVAPAMWRDGDVD
jgi:uncharacterized protein (DUF927 family)